MNLTRNWRWVVATDVAAADVEAVCWLLGSSVQKMSS